MYIDVLSELPLFNNFGYIFLGRIRQSGEKSVRGDVRAGDHSGSEHPDESAESRDRNPGNRRSAGGVFDGHDSRMAEGDQRRAGPSSGASARRPDRGQLGQRKNRRQRDFHIDVRWRIELKQLF